VEQRAVTRAEKNIQARQNRASAEAALARLDDLYKQFLWTEAEMLLEGAERLVGEEGDAEVRKRIAHAKRATRLYRDLDLARLAYSPDRQSEKSSLDLAAVEYKKAFAAYGLEIQAGQTEALAARIRDEEPALWDALIVGLDDWATCEQTAFRADLRTLADAIDTDKWRHEYRRAAAAKDGAALVAFKRAVEPKERS
jgi:hypothetical protein